MEEGWNRDRVVAIVRLACVLASTVAAGFGVALDADAMVTLAMVAVALAAGVWAWWKNNNLTSAAQEAQGYLDELKGKSEPKIGGTE